MTLNKKITVYGAMWCIDCRRAKKFLDKHKIAYEWINIQDNKQARNYVRELNNGKQIIPTIIFPDGTILVEPTNTQLSDKLNLNI
jgi:glutaredoxin-like protein